ncbi:pyridoxamine 5'-phosphate oxidase family protein [Streptomyces tsukubensis]|uniref:Pyridoxamine 5'-phosphate oxidase n=1 Tax=Streptomyces tsukubensis TaxID=83656 RepID=A0A1V4A5W2_9ACTN|nr:pyridoxamine 5'-phosphate oxidase family protein [Streptomyces tsukubensis]OON76005.1 pyridoxamine 5'-phosphate oxidase [Streptomyces tsukubensis]QFR94097.1 pyridoxamine 5'-phosphate oxidase family protein [Streptomyces tsukubensis]
MSLSAKEREDFLAEVHIGAIAVAAGEGRGPLNVPIWYSYEPGGDLVVLTGRESRKARLIADAGRFTLMAQRLEPTIRYVSVEGPVVSTTPTTLDELTAMAARYLPAETADSYVKSSGVADSVTLRLRPEHWLGADLGSL